MEQYIYNLISLDSTLSTLLDDGNGGVHLYPGVVPRGIDIETAVTFSLITTNDRYPKINSKNYQFNIFAKTHAEITAIADALFNVFDEDNNNSSAGKHVVYSSRVSETDLGYDFDDETYQRESTYYFKTR